MANGWTDWTDGWSDRKLAKCWVLLPQCQKWLLIICTPVKSGSTLIWLAGLIALRYWFIPFDVPLCFMPKSTCSDTFIMLYREKLEPNEQNACFHKQTRNWRNLNMPWRRKISSFQSRKKSGTSLNFYSSKVLAKLVSNMLPHFARKYTCSTSLHFKIQLRESY